MGIVPGTEPGPYETEPLLAEEPLPPGKEERVEAVDDIERSVREGGSAEAKEADEAADAVEGEGQHEDGEETAEKGEAADGPGDVDTDGLDVDEEQVARALNFDAQEWREELPLIKEWFQKFGGDLPSAMEDELATLEERLSEAKV